MGHHFILRGSGRVRAAGSGDEAASASRVRIDSWSLLQQQQGLQGVRVFRLLDSAMRPAKEQQQQVTSIGGRALFVGTRSTTITRLQMSASTPTTCTCMNPLKVKKRGSQKLLVCIRPQPNRAATRRVRHACSKFRAVIGAYSMRAWRAKAAAPYYPVPTALELLLEDADVIQSMRLGLS